MEVPFEEEEAQVETEWAGGNGNRTIAGVVAAVAICLGQETLHRRQRDPKAMERERDGPGKTYPPTKKR